MEGSSSSGSTYAEWEAKRRFIASLIDQGGSIIDVGCANGFLLKSLQAWSGCTLVPFGIDIDAQRIEQARGLFPQYKDHFLVMDARDITSLSSHMATNKFDYVFWNFLGSWRIEEPIWQSVLYHLISMTQRRLILAFYGKNTDIPGSSDWYSERERLFALPSEFARAGFSFSGSKPNPSSYNQVIAWIDRGKPSLSQQTI
jgi:SAM-dependent methyltransferase